MSRVSPDRLTVSDRLAADTPGGNSFAENNGFGSLSLGDIRALNAAESKSPTTTMAANDAKPAPPVQVLPPGPYEPTLAGQIGPASGHRLVSLDSGNTHVKAKGPSP